MATVNGADKPRTKPQREDLKAGECLCTYCPAKCCRYFALPFDTPTEMEDFEFIRWFLLHERATMFIEDGAWYVLIYNKCKHLRDDNLCGIYETRPQVCRDYTTDKCEYDDDWVYDHYFETAEQIQEYAEAVLLPKHNGSIRSPKPEALKVLNA